MNRWRRFRVDYALSTVDVVILGVLCLAGLACAIASVIAIVLQLRRVLQ